MVPTPLILTVLLIAFFPSVIAYLVSWPKRRLVNPFFVVLACDVTLMLVAVIPAIFEVRIVWLSWVVLASAILLVPRSMTMYRRARTIERAREREITERRARGG
jgi:hypothetical protein